MPEQIVTHQGAVAPVDIDAKIRQLSRRIPRLEDMLTWGGYAKPYTPENPAVIAERTNRQLTNRADDLASYARAGYSLTHTAVIEGADYATFVDTLTRQND